MIPFAGTMVYMAFKSLSRFIEACSVGGSKPHNSRQTLLHIFPPFFPFSFVVNT